MLKDEKTTNKIYAVIGPTAGGKSNYAIELAKLHQGEIINVDAYSIYKELDIVSAKVSVEEMQGVQHHFVSRFSITESVDIAMFQTLVRNKIRQLHANNTPVVLVGGSNLYMQAILFNYEIDNQLKYDYEKYENLDISVIEELIKKTDPNYLKVAQKNKRRMIKALLYFENTGLLYSNKKDTSSTLYYENVEFHYLDWKRNIIYERITIRVKKMFALGLRNEYETLVKKYGVQNQAFKAIGFSEFVKFPELDDKEMSALIAQNTRRLAKRQMTWLNNKILNNQDLNIKHVYLSKK